MKSTEAFKVSEIKNKIHIIRGQNVMFDFDLAQLYGVPVKRLNEQVRRNIERFPADFMFQLTENEAEFLRSQFATLEMGRGKYSKYQSLAFTQEGIAMLSGVLKSETAVKVNIEIMRTFVRMKNVESETHAIWSRINQLEKKYDSNFAGVFEAIRQLMSVGQPKLQKKIKPPSE